MTVFSVQIEFWPIRGSFTIAREVKTESVVVTVCLERNGHKGCGECVPLKRYGQTPEGELHKIQEWLQQNHAWDRNVLLDTMAAGPARFALDTALWQLEASEKNIPLWQLTGFDSVPQNLPTSFTINGKDPEKLAQDAIKHSHFRWLKLKLLGDGLDQERLLAVHHAAPHMELIVDANEGLTENSLRDMLPVLQQCNVVLIEQPLPAGQDECLRDLDLAIPLAADESCHTADDLEKLVGKYQVVNLKLDKTGGLTHGLDMKRQAEKMGFRVMVGCMASTSLSILPAFLLAQGADFIDLDGALLLERDRDDVSLRYDAGRIFLAE